MTVRELAKQIGVSPATISNVLNGKPGVSQETRLRVLEAIETHQYSPPPRRTKSNRNVLLLKFCKSGQFVEENQGFIATIIDCIADQLRIEQLGLTMTVARTSLKAALESIDYSKYCGMFLIATEIFREDLPLLGTIPIPFVVVDNTAPNYPYSSVCMNNAENVYLALQFCKACGHQEIGYLGSSVRAENLIERHDAFLRYADELGFHFTPENEYLCSPTMLAFCNNFSRILEAKPALPSCFFAENDTIALGAIKALKEKGCRVPRDVSVIGFDDISYSSISSPALTTIHVQRNLIGKQAVAQLIQLIQDPRFAPMKTKITGWLAVRSSVRDLKAENTKASSSVPCP